MILSNHILIRMNLGTFSLIPSQVAFFTFAPFGRIEPLLPGFFEIAFQFETILGGSASFLQKRRFEILRFFKDGIDQIDRTYRKHSVSIVSIEGLVRWSVDDDGLFGLEKTIFPDF